MSHYNKKAAIQNKKMEKANNEKKNEHKNERFESISRKMSRILRHRALEIGVSISPDGYVKISDLIGHIQGVTEDDIKQVVEYDKTFSKGRYSISEDGVFIRCNQGHSIKDIQAELFMTKIDDPSKVVFLNKENNKYECIHGTTFQRLNNIKLVKDIDKEKEEKEGDERTGLSICSRQHVHFAKGLPGDENIKSGMRENCNILFYCDMEAAIASGLIFYESENGVILSEGNKNGIVPSRFLRCVVLK
jgi:2'-phosphotransferase